MDADFLRFITDITFLLRFEQGLAETSRSKKEQEKTRQEQTEISQARYQRTYWLHAHSSHSSSYRI